MVSYTKWTSSISLLMAIWVAGLVWSGNARAADSFENFQVQVDNPYVDSVSGYHLNFTLSAESYGLLNNSRLLLEFPRGFGLASVDSVSLSSNHPERQYKIESISIAEEKIVLQLEKTGEVDGADRIDLSAHRVNFGVEIFFVHNPGISGLYQMTATAYKRDDLLAGPSLSEPFEIIEFHIGPKPELQIVCTELISPNSPKVNTGQIFLIFFKVVNKSGLDAQQVVIELNSDGLSVFESKIELDEIRASDTVQAVFEVTAAAVSGIENFATDIFSHNVIELEPIDNQATAIIQTPALLQIISSVADGATINLPDHEPYAVTFKLVNLGEASVGKGHYILTITGNEIYNQPEVISGEIVAGQTIEYVYNSTYSGRAVFINFRLDGTPIDSNNLEPAPIIDNNIEFTLIERPVFQEHCIDSFAIENNPFNPLDGPVNLVYNLCADSDVEFRVFTLTGEAVQFQKYVAGSPGGQSGANQIQWDGRNDAGETVLNGVYVSTLNVLATGETATLRIAILK